MLHARQMLRLPDQACGLLVLASVHEQLGQDVDVRQVGGLWEGLHLLLQDLGRPLGRPHLMVQPGQHLHSLHAVPRHLFC